MRRLRQGCDRSEFVLLGVERGEASAFALVGEPGTRKYVGSAFVSVNREMRERLCKRGGRGEAFKTGTLSRNLQTNPCL